MLLVKHKVADIFASSNHSMIECRVSGLQNECIPAPSHEAEGSQARLRLQEEKADQRYGRVVSWSTVEGLES